MGVHGLTTYLREKQRLLSTAKLITSSQPQAIPIVVDGWSFIYHIYNSYNLPWVYGGEYSEFSRLVRHIVECWMKIGLQIFFVFDGPCPDLKFPTIISRMTESRVRPGQLFFRTSEVSRANGRFLRENRILPPLAYAVCVEVLQSLRSNQLELHFADEEGDPYAVELAGRLGGYVVGNDSDFVIFNASGYRGYIPMDEMVWQIAPSDDDLNASVDGDDDFQTVKKPKAKAKPMQKSASAIGAFPPENQEDLSMSFISYSPDAFANHLRIPASLLPLLAALVGNDFSKDNDSSTRRTQALFFERQLTLIERIEKVANAIRDVIAPDGPRRKAKHQVGSVMDLIDRTVNSLLVRHVGTLGSGEIDAIIDKIVNATLQYAIPKYSGETPGREGLWESSFCALHQAESCGFLPLISRRVMWQAETNQSNPQLLQAREKYLDAYRRGTLEAKVMDTLNTASFWPRLFLENPDLETVQRSIAAPIRRWVYAILDDILGLPPSTVGDGDSAIEGSVDEPQDEDEDEDELIDVVEIDSEDEFPDYLAPLKGELHKLHPSDDEVSEPPPSILSHHSPGTGPVIISEYIRRGTRIASEDIRVPSICDQLESIELPEYSIDDAPPLTLRSEEDRLTILLRILRSDVASVRHLAPAYVVPVLALRWVASSVHLRWKETGSWDREKERWTKAEAACFLASCFDNSMSATPVSKEEYPPIQDRNIQLTAQVLAALEAVEEIVQVLLLTERVPFSLQKFSGMYFHRLLTSHASIPNTLIQDALEASQEGMTDAFQEERVKKGRKPKPVKSNQHPVSVMGSNSKDKKSSMASKGLFSMLADMDT
ncbi:hypothetical protein CVT24_008282 [Panaeolus cyanescens]|uniref:Asteroid domain-containing protein n=1 Tax=Panaeolus cyanescens TaxID=181874 RepID=A0A409YQI3_9AGAR|nr:hypothetical protein CVT24_008282 [Panaeolus cyanescens]